MFFSLHIKRTGLRDTKCLAHRQITRQECNGHFSVLVHVDVLETGIVPHPYFAYVPNPVFSSKSKV